MPHALVQQEEENVSASLSSKFFFFNLLYFVLKVLNMPASLFFKGSSHFIPCACQGYYDEFPPETIATIVSTVI